MMNAASTSNPSVTVNVGEAYPYPSHTIGPNFVTMKLSGKDTYNVWETQVLCLLKSQHMSGFVEGQFPSPAGNGKGKVGDIDAWIASNFLVKGWILGSLSDGVAKKVVNRLKPIHNKTDFTAKDLWNELQRSYGPPVREQATETKLPTRQAESEIEVISVSEDAKSKDESLGPRETLREIAKQKLYDLIIEGDTDPVIRVSALSDLYPWEKLTNNGNTVLHVAVGSSTKNSELLEKLLEMTPKEKLLDVVNSDGSGLLHVAAIGDNIKAVDMLVKRNPKLLFAKDKEGHIPLALSISNMHTETSHCLFKHMKEHGYANLSSSQSDDSGQSDQVIKTSECLLEHMQKMGYDALFTNKSGEELVVLAISCQDFRLARQIIDYYRGAAILDDSDAVLTALAQNFPRELNFWERRFGYEFVF